MSNSVPVSLLAATLLLTSNAWGQSFEPWTLGFSGCAGLDDDGRLVIQTCYGQNAACAYSSAVLVASVPGTFTVDLDWDIIGEKDFMSLLVSTASGGGVFSVTPPFGFDAWCDPIPCGEHVDDITIHVEPGDEVRFELSSNGEPCAPGPDGTRCIFDDIFFVPDAGVYDLGHAHPAAPIYELDPPTLPDYWVSGLDTVGDIDGDGVSDYAVGTLWVGPVFQSPGRVTAFSGATGAEIFAFDGVTNGQLGFAVAGLGDVDGGGVADFAVGEHKYPGGTNPSGRVLILSGETGAPAFELVAPPSSSNFGEALDGAGDVDGDGFGDLVVGIPGDDRNGVGAGAVEVYSGATGAVLHTFLGDVEFDYFGRSVAGVGDVDADGVPDVAGGSLQSDFGALASGLVRVWSGATGAVLHEFAGLKNDQFARVLCGVGDVDGDGHADIAFGNSSADNRSGVDHAGRIEVRSGATGELLYSRGGSDPYQYFGADISAVGDFDGDGLADLAVSDHKGAARGRAFVFGGPAADVLLEFSSDNHTLFANRLSAAGDLDGDGHVDLLASGRSVTGGIVLVATSGDAADHVTPALRATGTLEPGSALELAVTDGPPLATGGIVFGFSTADLSTLGGFLVPSPDRVLTGFALDADGTATLSTSWPAQFVAPLSVVAQVWIPEPAALSGFVATNAVALNPH